MRCLYREKIHKCGEFLEVDIFPVFEYQRGRSKKRKPTTETQQRLNQRNAERKLTRLLNTNFTKRDIRFDLTSAPILTLLFYEVSLGVKHKPACCR